MAREVIDLEGVGGWPGAMGWLAAVIGPLLVYAASRRKTDVDESALVLSKWKEMVEAHETTIKRLTEDFDRERKHWREENERLMSRITELEAAGKLKDAKIEELENQVKGLQRSIIQNSQSAGVIIAATREKRGEE